MNTVTPSIKTLVNLARGQIATIHDVSQHDEESRCRLFSLGIYPGVEVEVLRSAPLGDPLQVRCGSTLVSIRKKEACLIEVNQ